mgnify:FL=1
MKKIIIGVLVLVAGFGIFKYFQKAEEENKYKKMLVCANLETIGNKKIFPNLINANETKNFYQEFCKQNGDFVWFEQNLTLSKRSSELQKMISESANHGLNNEIYHKEEIKSLIKTYQNTAFEKIEDRIKFVNKIEIVLSDAYLALANDIYYGITDWSKFKSLQFAHDKILAKKMTEEKRLKQLEMNITNEVEEEKVRKFEWEKPPKQKFSAASNLLKSVNENKIYDSLNKLHPQFKEYARLVNALKIYRDKKADKQKINKIILNLERFRWITNNYDGSVKAVSVNIPSFKLQVLEYGEPVWSMRVIVGKPQRPTPILDAELTHATLNPYWTAPDTIIKEDILKKDNVAEYVESHNMKVFLNGKNGKTLVNHKDINWTQHKGKKDIPYTFRAEPGKDNPLGAIKFKFPNKYSVYMHDTNKKEFFAHDYRAFSSGCVRLHEPMKLFAYFMGKNDIDPNLFNSKNDPEQSVNLNATIPISFKYMTAVADKNSNVTFYEDIYGYDDTNMKAIKGAEKLFGLNLK